MLHAVMDLVENQPALIPYTTLKGCLVLAHQLTLVQKATKCLQVVAALPTRRQPQQKQGGPQGHNKGQQGHQVAGNKSQRASGGKYLCHTHAKFGEDAFHCADRRNCTWSGN